MAKKQVKLPVGHRPAMKVPEGGSCCANCKYYDADSDTQHGRCAAPEYRQYYGTDEIPEPPTQFCSDWYDWDG